MTKPANDLQKQDRTAQGRFKRGQSGNPKGKARGTRNHATQAVLNLLEGQAEAITQKLIDAALSDDMAAVKIIIDKLAPNSRELPLPALALPTVDTAQDLPKLTAAILDALASGELLPSQAAALSGLVATHGKALELTELEQRITALEGKQ